MRIGIFKICLLLAVVFSSATAFSENSGSERYERVSLCQFMVTYPHKVYFREIEQEYLSLPFPERYNNHSLGVNFIKFPTEHDSPDEQIDYFLKDAQIAKRCVSKWFSRKKSDGGFSVDLIYSRGYYNATMQDVAEARSNVRGGAWLADRGERLLGYTFVAVHDMRPFEEETRSTSGFNKKRRTTDDEVLQLSDSVTRAEYNRQYHSSDRRRSSYKIRCATYLYRLDWTESVADEFYGSYYSDAPDYECRKAYEEDRTLFKLRYVGSVSNTVDQKRERRIKSNEQLVKTALARVIDMNLAQLGRLCNDFKVKALLNVGADGELTATIGKKEDVGDSTVFEVLEREEDADGRLIYTRVGLVEPVPDRIWDNRFNAFDEDGCDDHGYRSTTFRPLTDFEAYPGLILREVEK